MSNAINLDATPPQEVRFLRLLDKEVNAFTFQTFADAEALKGREGLARVFHGDARDGRLHQMHDAGAGIYITVNETNGRGRKSEDIVRVRAVWRENDGGDLPPLPLEPSLVVETSPGHFHEYLLVTGDWPADKQGRADFDGVMERMVESWGSDKNAKDISRVLRVPGFLNRKYGGNGHAVRICKVHPQMRRYTRDEILQAFPPIYKIKAPPMVAEFAPSGTDEERIRDALFAVNADDREVWWQMGMAIKHELGEGGRGLWDEWSATSSKYEARDQDKVWRSFKSNGIGIGTLFHRAQAAGWRPAKQNGRHDAEPRADIPKAESEADFNGHDRQADHSANNESDTAPPPDTAELLSICAATIKMKIITWLWPDRFAVGKLGIIAGLPDEGKGQTLAFIAAQITNGGAWPMKEGRAPQGSVIVFSDEDDDADTLVPRLAAAGADLNRIHLMKMVRGGQEGGRMFSLITDLDLLRRKIKEIGDVKLIIIDPISAYLGVGEIDSFRTTDVRAVLTPLTTLATEANVAIIAIMHFNKKTDVTNALLRISDSLAFGAVARHVYGVVDDAENERKLFVRAKNNAAAKSKNKTLAYRFGARGVGHDADTGEEIVAPYILWEPDYVDVTAMEAMQAAADHKSPAARDEAKKFLADMLAKGPVPKTEVEEAAEANGISERTLRRAKADLQVVADKDRTKQDGKWFWKLPEGTPRRHWSD
jgi:hypothetical protein